MHIVTGACSFTPTGGSPHQIRADDTLFFPANTTGEWLIQKILCKVFAVLAVE